MSTSIISYIYVINTIKDAIFTYRTNCNFRKKIVNYGGVEYKNVQIIDAFGTKMALIHPNQQRFTAHL